MNQTKKITQGAMILAIVGALMLLDRQIGHYFDELLFLAFAIVIILYASMYTLKDAGMIAFGIVVLTFMFGSIFSYVYCPLGILAGFIYSYGVKKDWERNRLMLVTSIIMVIGEALLMMVIFPMLGIDFLAGMEEMQNLMNTMLAEYGLTGIYSNEVLSNILIIVYILDVVLIGIMESFLIHLLAGFLLKRFRIKEIRRITLYELKIHPMVAYLSILPYFGMTFIPYNAEAPILFYIFTTLSLIGGIILFVLGYIFALIYGKLVLKRNITMYLLLAIFFLLPYSVIILLILGFLYGSGPLRRYLERKVGTV